MGRRSWWELACGAGLLLSAGLVAPACGRLVSLDDRPCPCASGYTCCAETSRCVANGVRCQSTAAPDAAPPPSPPSPEPTGPDPFDSSTCEGPILSQAEARARLGSALGGGLGTFDLQLRTRACNAAAGCGPWSLGPRPAWSTKGRAALRAPPLGGPVTLVLESLATEGGAASGGSGCEPVGRVTPLACGPYVASSATASPSTIAWRDAPFQLRARMTNACARLVGAARAPDEAPSAWTEAEVAAVLQYLPADAPARTPPGLFDVALSDLGCALYDTSRACRERVATFCRARGAYAGGYGPVEWGPSTGLVVCASGRLLHADASDYASAATGCGGAPAPDDATAPPCNVAFFRLGGQAGYAATVFQSAANNELLAIPVEDADAVRATWPELKQRHDGCSRGAEPSAGCVSAVHRHCRALGRATGFGLVEYDDAGATLVCLAP